MTECQAVVFRTMGELDKLRECWSSMVREPETEFAIFSAVVRCRPNVIRPHVVSLVQEGTPSTILVGRVEKVELSSRIGYRTIFRPNVLCLTVLYCGLLGDDSVANCQQLRGSICNSLQQGEFDVVRFSRLDVTSPLYRTLNGSPHSYWVERQTEPTVHWELELPDSIEDIYKMRSSKTRGKIRRRQAQVRKSLGPSLSIEVHTDGAHLSSILRDMEEVARTTYQRRIIGAGFTNDEEWQATFELMFEQKQLRIYLMYIDRRAIAYAFGYVKNDRFFYGIPGYDPAYQSLGIGAFLHMHVIEDLCNTPEIRFFDYGFGDAEHKRALATNHWYESDVLLYAPRARNLGILSTRRLIAGAEHVARKVVAKLGWEGNLRRALRGRLSWGRLWR